MVPRPNSSSRLAAAVVFVACAPLGLPQVSPAAAAPSGSPAGGDSFGVLVMAHGGTPAWNQTVLEAVAPLATRHPVEVAFGMADACSMAEAVAKLEERGVRRIGVVRLFISGESWFERTEQILGLREGAPRPTVGEGGTIGECQPQAADPHAGHAMHSPPAGSPTPQHSQHSQQAQAAQHPGAAPAPHSMALFRVSSRATFTLSREGLMEANEMNEILADRARGLSTTPAHEEILILAHGPEDDAENERWLVQLNARAEGLRAMAFHEVVVETLREDWPDKRRAAEERIRALVTRSAAEGRRVIVLPFRLSGFGPYASILEGHPYVADQLGLLPHPAVTRWIERQVEQLEGTPQVGG